MTGTFKKLLTAILAIVMVAALLLGCVACSNPTADDNDKKGNTKAPDYKGKGMVSGVEVKIAVWKRTSQNGNEYWSGTIMT